MKRILIILLLAATILAEDYYQILGIPKAADEQQIKKAFKKLSLKYHPDKNRGNEDAARKEFVKIAQAYETLIDPEKRKIYDQYGEEGVKKAEAGGHPGGGFGGNFDDMFNQFFQFGNQRFQFNTGFRQQNQRREEPHEDLFQQSDVIEFTMSTLSSFYRRNEVWIVLFYKSNDKSSKAYKDVWRETAEKLYGIIKVAAINCHEEHEDALCEEFSVYDIPQILCFPANSRLEPIKYDGPLQYNSIAGFAVSHMESFVKIVNQQNLQEFSKEDFDKTKVLLFTSKKATPPLLKALSKDFKNRVVFGEIRQTDANAKLIDNFQVKSFPTLMVLTDANQHQGVIYQGDFKKDQIAKFLREHSSAPKKGSKPTKSVLFQELVLIDNGPCTESDNNLCLLALLDKTSRSDSLKATLEKLAHIFIEDPINFFYILGSKVSYRQSLGNLEGLPKLVILKSKKQRFVAYEGPFDENDMKNFIENILSDAFSTRISKIR